MKLVFFKGVFTSILLLNFTYINANWEPESCFSDRDLSDLSNQEFVDVKDRVSHALKGSWCSQEKIDLLLALMLIEKPKICVEIGAFSGSSVLPVAAMLTYLNQGKIYAIDGWSNSTAIRNLAENDPNKAWWSTVNMKEVQRSFRILMNSFKVQNYVQEIALASDDAVSLIPDEIDFLHLDGDYSEIGSLKDVELYIPKVKEGGYILYSNLFTMINGKQPKLKAFCALLENCEIVTEIENDNAILFKKL